MCSALGICFDDLGRRLERRVTPAALRRLEGIASQRIATRTPLAYLLNEAWLAGRRFYVDERVIVPRSHIAELLEDRIAPWIGTPAEVGRILDLCTGSGCLAILAALAFPNAQVDASDVSSDALAVAAINRDAYGLTGRMRVIHSDRFDRLPGMRYDLIVSNPPYVTGRAMRALPVEYRHEPALALDGGADGLSFVRRLLAEAGDHLTRHGILVVEIGANRRALERAYPRLPFVWLETAAGGDEVFLLHRSDLDAGRVAD